MFNIVEAIQGPDSDCAFDQPCRYGHRVEGHAVYCHNSSWDDSPRKCRNTWHTGGKRKDEDCPGFSPNPEFKGVFSPTIVEPPLCLQCGGKRFIGVEEGRIETCDRCEGDGQEPKRFDLNNYEQDTLELASSMARRPGERFIRIADNKEQSESINKLEEASLVMLRSVTWRKGSKIYLLESTAKGHAVMKANWDVENGK